MTHLKDKTTEQLEDELTAINIRISSLRWDVGYLAKEIEERRLGVASLLNGTTWGISTHNIFDFNLVAIGDTEEKLDEGLGEIEDRKLSVYSCLLKRRYLYEEDSPSSSYGYILQSVTPAAVKHLNLIVDCSAFRKKAVQVVDFVDSYMADCYDPLPEDLAGRHATELLGAFDLRWLHENGYSDLALIATDRDGGILFRAVKDSEELQGWKYRWSNIQQVKWEVRNVEQ